MDLNAIDAMDMDIFSLIVLYLKEQRQRQRALKQIKGKKKSNPKFSL